MATATVTPKDRLSFTFFLATSLHAALILGITFTSELFDPESPTIEVTIATHSDDKAPEDADFIAEANQIGSGTEADVMETTTRQQADFHANEFNEVIPDPLPAVPETVEESREMLTTVTASEEQAPDETEEPLEAVDSPLIAMNESYETLAQEIASLEARIAQEQQIHAKRPRVQRLTSLSTKTAAEASYLNMWRQKVERVGNANFPADGTYGSLRMLVVIHQDGTLRDVRILDSSGEKVLDDAALRIVRLAAPYQDFPVEMRKRYDDLEIIRTWQFTQAGNSLGG